MKQDKRLPFHICKSFFSQTLASNSMCGLFIHLQQLQWSALSTCAHTHRCTHAHTQTETLHHSPPHNRIPMWEVSQQLQGKANQRNFLPVKNEGWPLDWGACNVSRPTKRQRIKTHCGSELGQGWQPGANHGVIREEAMGFFRSWVNTKKKNIYTVLPVSVPMELLILW